MNTPSSGRELRLLQITDCHLYGDETRTLLGVNTRESFQQVLSSTCQYEKPQPDLIVCTGDLVHDGSEAGYGYLADSLAALACPAAALPGNHDNPRTMNRVLNGWGIQTGGKIDLDDWRLVLLDSHVPGEEGGWLSATALEQLEEALDGSARHILIFVHHQPVPIGSEWIDSIGLGNGQALLDRVKGDLRVKGIVWGHVHQAWEGRINHIQLLATPSTCIQFAGRRDDFSLAPQPPGWRMLSLASDGTLSSEIGYLAQMPAGLIREATGYR